MELYRCPGYMCLLFSEGEYWHINEHLVANMFVTCVMRRHFVKQEQYRMTGQSKQDTAAVSRASKPVQQCEEISGAWLRFAIWIACVLVSRLCVPCSVAVNAHRTNSHLIRNSIFSG